MDAERVNKVRRLSQLYAFTSIEMHEAIGRRHGFSGTDHKYLGFFIARGSMTAGELAKLTGLTTGAVTGLIDRFEKKNLVRREFSKEDRRKVLIVPDLAKIMTLLVPSYKDYRTKNESLLKSFSDDEIRTIETYFTRAIDIMEEATKRLKEDGKG